MSRRIFRGERNASTIQSRAVTMRNDATTAALEAAIEKAQSLNQEAGAALDKAIKAAIREPDLVDDYRYIAANKMLDVYIRSHNVAARYQIARVRKMKTASRRQG
jgi:hypothetical protein